jgi:3-oxosteroid 1-dehydrogenase
MRERGDAMTTSAFDLVVIGSGGAGLSAALTARSLGASVVVVESNAAVGGTYAYSSGLLWVPANTLAARDGVEDDVDLAFSHVLGLAGGKAIPAVLRAYLEAGPSVIDFLGSHGVPFEWVKGYPDYYAEKPGGLVEGRYLASPVFDVDGELEEGWRSLVLESPYYTDVPVSWAEIQGWGGYGHMSDWDWPLIERRRAGRWIGWGGATTAYLLKACLAAGVEMRLNTTMTKLVFDANGAVTGVRLVKAGHSGVIELEARNGVVLATGGYDHSPDMQRQFDPHPPIVALTNPGVTGRAIKLAMNAGAAFVNLAGQLAAPVYTSAQGSRPNLVGREMTLPGSFIVNREGRRFTDDSFYRSLAWAMGTFDPRTCVYPNLPAYLIFDQEYKDTYRVGGMPIGHVPDWLPRSETATGLAAELDIAGDLANTLEMFNADAQTGVDTHFGRGALAWTRANADNRIKPNPTMRRLHGRLYGLEISLGTMGTYSGLAVDAHARVLRSDNSVIERLYAVGNAMANVVEGYWYNSGTSNGRSLIFGSIAAHDALAWQGSNDSHCRT